jgi:hypothetical protein
VSASIVLTFVATATTGVYSMYEVIHEVFLRNEACNTANLFIIILYGTSYKLYSVISIIFHYRE